MKGRQRYMVCLELILISILFSHLQPKEGTILLTAEVLPKNEIECWREQHQGNLSRLQQLAKPSAQPTLVSCQEDIIPQATITPTQSLCLEENDTRRPAKRRRTEQTDVQSPSSNLPNDVFPMKLPARDKLPTILSEELLEGLQTSQVWLKEHSRSLTDTVCLLWPPERSMDFFIELIVSEPASTAVSEAVSQSNSAARKVLGDFLYKGVIESECIKNGGELTDAVITLDYGDGDRIVRVTLSHDRGWQASKVYPSTQ